MSEKIFKPIQLSLQTKEALDKLKIIPRESYDSVVARLLDKTK